MYKAAIIGAGSIGALKDDKFDYPGGPNILTHAHAVHDNKDTELIGIIDININKAKEAAKKWNTNFYTYIYELYKEMGVPDIFIIAADTAQHYLLLKDLFFYIEPKIVIVEKPFCSTLEKALEIKTLYDSFNIPIIVNYSRRFEYYHCAIKKDIELGIFGKIQACRVYYNRGLKRDGCHAIDLMNWWFGKCTKTNKLTKGIVDYNPIDPSCAAHFVYEKCPNVIFLPVDGRELGIFEIEIIGSKKKINLNYFGQVLNEVTASKENVYGGDYNSLDSSTETTTHTKTKQMLSSVLLNAVTYIDRSYKKIWCGVDDAIEVHKIIEEIH